MEYSSACSEAFIFINLLCLEKKLGNSIIVLQKIKNKNNLYNPNK